MSCRIKNLTYDEVRNAYVNKTGIWDKLENITPEEIATKLDILDQFITVKPIPNEQLPKEAYKNSKGVTDKYVVVNPANNNDYFVIPSRFTDAVQKKFEKIQGKDKAAEISSNPDNIIKAESGTTVHAIADQISHNIANNDAMFVKSSTKYVSNEELAKQYNVDINVVKSIEKIVQEHIKFFKETQKKIDPKGKIYLKTERLLTNTTAQIMGRGDLIAIFSDSSAGYIDYKTMSAKPEATHRLTGDLITDDWISEYKYEDFSLQFNSINKALQGLGVTKIRFSRVSPIFLRNYNKRKDEKGPGKNLSTKIKSVEGVGQFFKPIPISIEETGIQSLDNAIAKLVELRSNYQNRLSKEASKVSAKSEELRARIFKINKSVQALTVDKDMTYMIRAYNSIINEIKDVDKLELKDLNELYDDLQVYIGITSTATTFYRGQKLEKQDFDKKKVDIAILLERLMTLNNLVKEALVNKSLTKEEIKAATDAVELSFVDKMFKTLSQIDHPLFQKFYSMYSRANDKTRKQMNTFEKQLKAIVKPFEDWGASNGYKGWDVYNLLINKDTGNLHSMLSSNFYEKFKTLQKDEKKKELQNILKLKDDWQETFDIRRQKYIINYDLDLQDESDVEKLRRWDEQNHPKTGKVIFGKYYGIYYEFKPEIFDNENYITKEYSFIKKNKPLLDYYNFWTKSMSEARQLLGHHENEQHISQNFIPWIKKETLEMLFESGLPSYDQIKDKISEIWSTTQDETKYGEIIDKSEQDLSTGKALRQIPRFFIQPFQNAKGEVDKTMKSYDLNKSLFTFMSIAHNYNNLSQIEAQTNALQDIIYQPEFGEKELGPDGQPIKTVSGRAKKLFGYSSSAAELFQKHVDYHLYGIRIQDKPGKVGETLMSLKKYQQTKELTFAPLLILTNYLGQQANMFFEGSKGFFYNRKQMLDTISFHKKALIPGTKESAIWNAVTYMFQPYGEKRINEVNKSIRISKALKWANEDNLFIGYRNADEHTSNLVLISMMKNYGISADGNVRRLSILPKDTKSLYDNIEIKGDELTIKGLTDEGFTQFRNTVMNVSRNIKGSLSQEDMNAINFTLLGTLTMSFKNWLPALALERFDKLSYDATSELIKSGRYVDLLNEWGIDKDKGISVFLPKVAKRLGLFALDVATFGTTSMLPINENRAKAMFEQYLETHSHLLTTKSRDELYKEYLEHKRGNLKAAAIELAVIVYLMLGILGLGQVWDDDSYQRRVAMRQLRRLSRELSFFIDPSAMIQTVGRNTIPLSGLAVDVQKLLVNTADEIRDEIVGENNKKDPTPFLYYGRSFMVGGRLLTFFEVFEADEKKQF